MAGRENYNKRTAAQLNPLLPKSKSNRLDHSPFEIQRFDQVIFFTLL
jgi:hypothetical protein